MKMNKMEVDKLMNELENCLYCSDGACSNCHGTGFVVATDITYPDLKTRLECSICNGTGKCPECGGSGKRR